VAGLGFIFHHHRYGAFQYEVQGITDLTLFQHVLFGLVGLALAMPQEIFHIGYGVEYLWFDHAL